VKCSPAEKISGCLLKVCGVGAVGINAERYHPGLYCQVEPVVMEAGATAKKGRKDLDSGDVINGHEKAQNPKKSQMTTNDLFVVNLVGIKNLIPLGGSGLRALERNRLILAASCSLMTEGAPEAPLPLGAGVFPLGGETFAFGSAPAGFTCSAIVFLSFV